MNIDNLEIIGGPQSFKAIQIRYKCRYCGESRKELMWIYNKNKNLYSANLCNYCYNTEVRKKIPIIITNKNSVQETLQERNEKKGIIYLYKDGINIGMKKG